MNIIHRPICWEDQRGSIRDVFAAGAPDCVTLIASKKGAVRGNHYHRESSQYAFVVSGRMTAFVQSKTGEIEKREMGPGDMVLHEPNEPHAYLALEDTVFLAFASGIRKGSDYEKDTHRVPPLFDPDVELAADELARETDR